MRSYAWKEKESTLSYKAEVCERQADLGLSYARPIAKASASYGSTSDQLYNASRIHCYTLLDDAHTRYTTRTTRHSVPLSYGTVGRLQSGRPRGYVTDFEAFDIPALDTRCPKCGYPSNTGLCAGCQMKMRYTYEASASEQYRN